MFEHDLKALDYSRRKPASVSSKLVLTDFKSSVLNYVYVLRCDVTKIVLWHQLDPSTEIKLSSWVFWKTVVLNILENF